MPDDSRATDVDIILDAYAEKVRESFKIFAENLGMGQNYKSSTERFMRSLELIRKARDMALEAMSGTAVVEPAEEGAATADPNKVSAADMSPLGTNGLSAEDQKMIEHALEGTTGQKPLVRR
jgi:hypothetical protein